jgi:hypothetical protein
MPAATYKLIAKSTLSSNSNVVTFSSIPDTFTDLALRISTRDTALSSFNDLQIRFNGDTATNYSYTFAMGNGAGTSSSIFSSQTYGAIYTLADSAAANNFASSEIYIPSYKANQFKPFGVTSSAETPATTAYILAYAELWRNTAAITSIELKIMGGGSDFKSGSSFFLYGIKNS